MNTHFDIIVSGSGPAGATAAYRLARDGFKTLLLEKEKLPRYKACGGGITTKVLRALDFDVTPMLEDSITRITLAHAHRAQLNLRFGEPVGWCVMRDKFDNYLTERAAEAGAEMHDDEAIKQIAFEAQGVRVKTNHGEYTSEIIVGADGANSITARAANLHQPRNIGAALEVELAVPPAQLDAWRHTFLFDMGALPFGYAWIFPKADHLSVGIGSFIRGTLFHSPRPRASKHGSDLRAWLNEWMSQEPTLQNHRVLHEQGHLVPLGTQLTPLHGSRVALVGDAGGLIEPLLGEGIYYAMRSGQIAAEVIGEALRREDFDLTEHTRRVHTEFGNDFQNAASLARFLYHQPYLSLQALKWLPFMRDAVMHRVDGKGQMKGWLWRAARVAGNWMEHR